MSVYGYGINTTPFLQSIRSQLLIFNNAFSNSGVTTGSITSLLTGQSPFSTKVVFPPDMLQGSSSVRSLPSLLGSLGYRRSNWAVPHLADPLDQNLITAFDSDAGVDIAASPLNRLPLGIGLSRWFVVSTIDKLVSLVLDVSLLSEADNPMAQITGKSNSLSDEQRLEGAIADFAYDLVFINIHFMDTHGPQFQIKERKFSLGKEPTDWDDHFYNDAIIEFDRRIERIFGNLQQSDKLENSIVIITSDHARGWKSTKRVPLILRLPGQKETGVRMTNVQLLDIAPTVLDVLGFARPPWLEGDSLLGGELRDDRILLAVSIKGAKPAEGGEWAHYGWIANKSSAIGPYHYVNAILCDTYFEFDIPLSLVSVSKVEGSTSPCTASKSDAAEVAQAVQKALISSD